MRIAVISDLHLGCRDAVDRFGHDTTAFVRFLQFLEGNFERIVLLGDVYETLTARTPLRHAHELARVRDAHPELVRRFARPQYAYVHGNHDLVARRVLGAPEQLVLEAGGVRVLFTHGHPHDWVIRHTRGLAELAVWAGAWLRRAGLGPLYRAFDAVDVWLHHGAGQTVQHRSFQAWSLARAASVAADVVVTGHTHHALRAEHGARLFLNSGSCADGQLSFLALDTAAGTYTLHSGW